VSKVKLLLLSLVAVLLLGLTGVTQATSASAVSQYTRTCTVTFASGSTATAHVTWQYDGSKSRVVQEWATYTGPLPSGSRWSSDQWFNSSLWGRLLNNGTYLVTYNVGDPWWPTSSNNVFTRNYLIKGTVTKICDVSDGH